MRGLTRRWKILASPTETALVNPSSSLPPLVRRVMNARGIDDDDEIRQFCEPILTDLHDPGLLPGIDHAAERIVDAIRRNEQIVIYGDYDVDGITATAILYHTIKTIQPNAQVKSYVPHRIDEGYGLNVDALQSLKTDGAQLVITVDCGITGCEAARLAKRIGLDLIITDHHLPNPDHELPDALAIVHPGLADSQYPFADLCGAGVAFKLAWRLAVAWCNSERVSEQLQTQLINMLPLVALGTIADVMPLTGENRIMTSFGLSLIKQTPLVGLRSLIHASGLMDESIDTEKVGFVLAPRLNACGRMGHAADAVHLLTSASELESSQIAEQLTKVNVERQRVERRIFEHACQMAEDSGMISDETRAIVLAHESWHPGVVGIVCSRLVSKYSRPAILLNRTNNICKGSGRSIDNFSLIDALSSTAHYLTTYGGHEAAAGMTLNYSDLDGFTQTFTDHANARIPHDQLVPTILVDCHANLNELTEPCVQHLHLLAPFGRGNRRPTICIENLTIMEPPRQIGSHGKHLSMRVRSANEDHGQWLRTVWWRAGSLANDLVPGMNLDAAVVPKLNHWNGRTSVEAEILDVRHKERTPSPRHQFVDIKAAETRDHVSTNS